MNVGFKHAKDISSLALDVHPKCLCCLIDAAKTGLAMLPHRNADKFVPAYASNTPRLSTAMNVLAKDSGNHF